MTGNPAEPEHVDVLIVGAGISGIAAAYYLQRDQPGRSYAVVEARASLGGTWDLFRYPGIRSDSDLHTFGFEFKPWRDEDAIASGDKILAYLREAVAENGIENRIRYHQRVVGASWSSADARWTVDIERADTGERVQLSANWIFCGSGYYRYDEGFTPQFDGRERFRGRIVHPQQWPEDLDYTDKRVVVIGSGATAVTLVPAMAERAGHVTMLQRSPSYIISLPAKDSLANLASKVLGVQRGYAFARRKNIAQQRAVYVLSQRYPKGARRLIRRLNTKALPPGYPVDEHFKPAYDPWDQRLCLVPNGDLFDALGKGRASVVTDRIDTFTETGIRLVSGRELDADIIVTATGLNLIPFGGMELTVDGDPVRLSDTVAYRSFMLSGIPNFVFSIGYTNASWTLKVGLVCERLCRMLSYLDAHGFDTARPELDDPSMPTRPLLDFGAGYVRRTVDRLPRQGNAEPWVVSMSYYEDVERLRKSPIADPSLRLSRSAVPARA